MLLLIPRARSTVVLVLLVVMFAVFLFGAKSLGMPIPWADRLVQRVALGASQSEGIGMVRLGELAKLLQGSGVTTKGFRGLWGSRGVIATYEQRDSSVKMVKGINLNAGRFGAGDDAAAAAAHLPKAGRGTNGVLSPEDSSRMAGGVPLNENELLEGLTKNAAAQKGAGEAGRGDSVDMLKNALQRGKAVSPGSEIQFPGLRGGEWGSEQRLSAFGKGSGGGNVAASNGAVSVLSCTSQTCARHNLAEVKALACAAADPGQVPCGKCQTGRCPGEYAYHQEDAPYSGGEAGGGILTTDSEPVPITPDAQASLQSEYASANRDENCTKVYNQNHGTPTFETQLNQQFQSCCAQVDADYNTCWNDCTSHCFLGFLFCSNSCHQNCNPPANTQVQNCTNTFVSAHNAIASAQYAACPGSPGVPAQTAAANEPWSAQCKSY